MALFLVVFLMVQWLYSGQFFSVDLIQEQKEQEYWRDYTKKMGLASKDCKKILILGWGKSHFSGDIKKPTVYSLFQVSVSGTYDKDTQHWY